jgi:acyl carrier protein
MPATLGRDIGGQAHVAPAEIRRLVRGYVVENLLLGEDELDDAASLVETGLLDSTGALELVAFLESEFHIRVTDDQLVPANVDSIERLVAFVTRMLAEVRT